MRSPTPGSTASLRTIAIPNTGPGNYWQQATPRPGCGLGLMAMKAKWLSSALTARTWGFYDVLFKGHESSSSGSYGSYVMRTCCSRYPSRRVPSQTPWNAP